MSKRGVEGEVAAGSGAGGFETGEVDFTEIFAGRHPAGSAADD